MFGFRLNKSTGYLEPSKNWTLINLALYVSKLPCIFFRVPNFSVFPFVKLKACGPMKEERLCFVLLSFQVRSAEKRLVNATNRIFLHSRQYVALWGSIFVIGSTLVVLCKIIIFPGPVYQKRSMHTLSKVPPNA